MLTKKTRICLDGNFGTVRKISSGMAHSGKDYPFFLKQSEADDFMDNYLQGPKSEVFHKKFNLIWRAGGFLYCGFCLSKDEVHSYEPIIIINNVPGIIDIHIIFVLSFYLTMSL